MIDYTQALWVGLIGGGIGLTVVLFYLLIRTILIWIMGGSKKQNSDK